MKKNKLDYNTTIFYNRTYFNGKGNKIKTSYTRSVIRGNTLPETRSYYTSFHGFLTSDDTKGFFTQFFAVIVILLLAVTVIRIGRGFSIYESMPTFESFLKTVVSAPVISPVLDIIPTNLGTWVISFDLAGYPVSISFDFLRIFVESFLSIVNFLLWLVQNLFLVLQYLFYFLRWVFQM